MFNSDFEDLIKVLELISIKSVKVLKLLFYFFQNLSNHFLILGSSREVVWPIKLCVV